MIALVAKRPVALVSTALVCWLTMVPPVHAQPATKKIEAQASPGDGDLQAPAVPDRFDVSASDGSTLKVKLLDAKIPLKTKFGTLQIPVADIRQIDFATRVSDATIERIEAAAGKLGDEDYETREEASGELLALGAAAYPALLAAAQSEDPEVARRAELLLEQIRKGAGSELLEFREEDIVHTDSSHVAGTIDLDAIAVETALFGEQKLKLELLRRLSYGSGVDNVPGPVLADPGTMTKYRAQIGKTLYIRVTGPQPGVQKGAVWGTNIYTYDSHLASAAVHAGVVAPGQTKVVAVTVLPQQRAFKGSARNGITTGNWGDYPAAFAFTPVGNVQPVPRIQAVPAMRQLLPGQR